MTYSPEAQSINGYYFKDANGRNLITQEAVTRQAAIENEASIRQQQINEEASTRQTEILSEANTRQSQFSSLQLQIQTLIQNGYVPYAVDSTSDMTDHNRIYVLKSSGKWYYYDSSTTSWVVGGDYQAISTATLLSDVTEATLPKTIDFSSLSWVRGGVGSGNHKFTNDTDRFRCSTIIKLKAGSVINFTGVGDGYQFKASLFKEIPQFFNTFISEPIAYVENATTLTIPKDSYVVLSVKKADGSTIAESDIPTLAEYLNTSILYACDEGYGYGDLTNKVNRYTGYLISDVGQISASSGNTTMSAIPVKEGDYVSILNTSGSGYNCFTIITKNGAAISLGYSYSTTQPCNGYVCPANSAYFIASYTTTAASGIKIRTMAKPDNYQHTLGCLTEGEPVKLIAHRGLEEFAPEATVPAYTIAGEKGMWGCKLDICETSDGYFVMSHDSTVDRMFNGTGNIIDMTLAQLQTLTVDAGNHIADYPNEKIVTLEKALTICKKYQMHPVIEMKNLASSASVARILEILNNYGVLNQTICQCSAGNRLYITELRAENDHIPIIYWSNDPNLNSINHSSTPLFNAVQALSCWDDDYKTDSFLSLIRGLQMPLCVAVADTENALTIANTAIEKGAIYIVTDRITPSDIAPDTYTE